MRSSKVFPLLCAFVAILATSNGTEDKMSPAEASERRMADCLEEGDFGCIKAKVLNNLHKLIQKKSLRLMDGLVLDYTGDEKTKAEAARAIKEENWSGLLGDIIPKMVQNLGFNVNDARGHQKRLILPFLAAAGFYTFLLTLGVIAAKFLGSTSLLVGIISLVLSAINGLAKVVGNQNRYSPPVTYTHYDAYGHHPEIEHGPY